jgi:hypothetical protein
LTGYLFGDFIHAYVERTGSTKGYRYELRDEILKNRKYYEARLDRKLSKLNMGHIWHRDEIAHALMEINDCGLQVLRNHKGQHRITIPYIERKVKQGA